MPVTHYVVYRFVEFRNCLSSYFDPFLVGFTNK